MPHVKGNKFKPKVEDVEPQVDAAPAAETEAPPPKKRRVAKKPPPPAAAPAVPTVVAPPPKGKSASKAVASNWQALKGAIDSRRKTADEKRNKKKNKRKQLDGGDGAPPEDVGNAAADPSTAAAQATRVLAIDCEMVGVGKHGDKSILARVSIVNAAGVTLLDSFVAPTEPVTDFRTKWSGVRPSDVRGAPSIADIKPRVASLLRGRLLVGHSIENDLEALGLQHPNDRIRDTARYPPLMRTLPGGRQKPRSLRELAEEHLGLGIQGGEHCSVEDARAALGLYNKHRTKWDKWLAAGGASSLAPAPSTNLAMLVATGGGQSASNSRRRKQQQQQHGSHSKQKEKMGAQRLTELAKNDYMADL